MIQRFLWHAMETFFIFTVQSLPMKVLITALTLLLVTSLQAQTFPDDWIGNYAGNMIIGSLGRPNDTIPVEFEFKTLEEDSVWSYAMTYHSERFGTVIKDYKIVAERIGSTQRFVLDENNGIVMELSLMDGTFYGMYEVMDQLFISTMRKTEDGIYFDLFGGSVQNPTVTSAGEGEEKVEATSHRTTFHQTVLLKPTE